MKPKQTQKVVVKPSYETLENAYKCCIKDITNLWKVIKPNETFITEKFLYKEYLKFGKEKNDKN